MKNIFFKYLLALVLFAGAMSVVSCKNSDEGDNGGDVFRISAIVPDIVDVGQTLSIVGSQMDAVTAVEFAGGATVNTFKRVGLNQIDVVVPAGAQNGQVKIKTDQTEALSEVELRIANVVVTEAFPAVLQTADVLTINGEDLKAVKEIIFPDNVVVPAMSFERKCDEQITVKVPVGTIDGEGMVSLVSYGGKAIDVLAVDITVVEITDPSEVVTVLWEGSATVDWSDTKIAASNEAFAGVPAGAIFTIYFEPVPTNWATLKIKRSVAGNSTFENAINPAGNWGFNVDEASTSGSFEVTQADLDVIAADAGGSICVQGQGNVVVTKVTLTYAKAAGVVLFEGSFDIGNWSNNLVIPSSEFAQFKEGDIVTVEFTTSGDGQFKICPDSDWSGFANYSNNSWGGYDIPADATSLEFAFTADDLTRLAAADNFAIQGKNAVVTKVMVTPQ